MEEEIIFRIEVPGGSIAVKTLEDIANANKVLREERKKLNLATEEGVKRANEINAAIDRNDKKFKEHASSLEKQRLNIGNYASAIDKLIPGFDGLSQAVSGSKTFIDGAGKSISGMGMVMKIALGPIGLLVAALGVMIASLSQSEEGQDRLAKITTVLGVVFNKFFSVVESVGEVLFDAVSGVSSMTDKLGIFGVAIDIALTPLKLLFAGLQKIAEFTGFDKVIEDTIKTGEAIANLNDEIEARENELIVRRAETNAKVQALREQAITQEGALKRKTIAEAIQLEKDLAKAEKEQIDAKLKAFDLEAKSSGALTEEQKKQRAELLAAQIDADAQGAQSTIKFQKELEALNDKQNALLQSRLDKEKELNEIALEQQLERIEKEKELYDIQIEDFREFLEGKKAVEDEIVKIEEDEEFDREDKAAQQDNIRVANEIKRDKLAGEQRLKTSQILFGGLEQSLRAFGLKSKVISSGLALANTFLGVTEILKAPTSPFIEPFASIVRGVQIATTIATGLGAIKQINSAQFARGGLLANFTKIFHDGGLLSGPSHAQGGIPFSVGGRLGFEAEGGEAIINRRSTAMYKQQLSAINVAGGGVPFAVGGITNEVARSSESATSQREIFNAIAQIKPVVTVEDINIGQNRVEVIEQRAQVI